jgi:hypothetical protein
MIEKSCDCNLISTDKPRLDKMKVYFLIIVYLLITLLGFSQGYAQQNTSPSFTYMESKFIDEEKFSITFPSISRRTTITQTVEGQKLNITSYQADDGIGLYTFSIGELEKSLPDESAKKFFVENLFKSLVSTATGAKIYTQEQANKNPYNLSYLYTSKLYGIDWVHMGMIFLLNKSAYIKITLIYPVEKIETAYKKYLEFLNSLKIK